ncbi:hypothetical protein J6590_056461 [Homalodisca vitripennis]|nr:hypothetical protein J6590_056461 [Homalodisca vitripennis]
MLTGEAGAVAVVVVTAEQVANPTQQTKCALQSCIPDSFPPDIISVALMAWAETRSGRET